MNYAFQPTCQIPPETLDKIYMDAFGFKTDGVFVEFGAHDGWHWSATWGLAEIGWRGVYAEPDAALFKQCKATNAARPNVDVYNCCIGKENEITTLGQGEYGATKDSDRGQFKVVQYTLDTFLDSIGAPRGFDLLVIDVEGMEADVFSGFTCAKWMPRLIIVERPPANNFLELGYAIVYEDWINSAFALKK